MLGNPLGYFQSLFIGFPFSFPAFFSILPSFFHLFASYWPFSSLFRLAKLLVGTLSLYLPEHLPLDSYTSCANKLPLSCLVAYFVASLLQIQVKKWRQISPALGPMSAAPQAAAPSFVA